MQANANTTKEGKSREAGKTGRQLALIEVKMSPESANLYNTAHSPALLLMD